MIKVVRPVRIGLIGLGPWGLRHATALTDCEAASLVAAATTRAEAAARLPQGVRVYRDWYRLLEDPAIDAVVIATPPEPRPAIAEAAIKASLSVLMEKPAALDPQALQQLGGFAYERRVVLSVAHLHLYAPAFKSLHAAVEKAGGAQCIESAGGGPGPNRPDCSALWDYGPHDLSMIRALAGRSPDRLGAQRLMAGHSPQDGLWRLSMAWGGMDAAASADLTATVHVGNVLQEKSRLLSVKTAEGHFIYDDRAGVKVLFARTGGESVPLPYDDTPPLTATLRRFADLVASGARVDPDLPAAIDVLGMLAAADESLSQGGPVALSRTPFEGPEPARSSGP